MRKRRSDSPWGRLTLEQRKQMDEWFFIDNLAYEEIAKRAGEQFGVTASFQTLTGYFRHRRNELDLADEQPGETVKEKIALMERIGLGKGLAELEARTLAFSAAAAYELALAQPDKMRVKEVRTLMKMVSDHRRRVADEKLKTEKFKLQEYVALMKLKNGEQKKQTKEEFEGMMMEAADIMHRARKKAAEDRAALDAERAKHTTENKAVDSEGNTEVERTDKTASLGDALKKP